MVMTVDDKIRDEKMQYYINREAAKISSLSSSKVDKNEYLPGEETLPPDKARVIEQAKFTYTPWGKGFWKGNKNDWGSRQEANKSNWRTWEIANWI